MEPDQRDALEAVGCGRIFEETASGARRERPQLRAALDWMREGNTFVVWRLDRLARSIRQLIETVEDLGVKRPIMRSQVTHLTEQALLRTPLDQRHN